MITLICGLPRAGKTTYSTPFEETQRVVHWDNCGNGFFSRNKKALEIVSLETGDIMVEGIYNKPEARKELAEAYKGGGKKVCIWLDTPLEVRSQRQGFCPFDKTRFEPPTEAEGWDEIIVIKQTK